MLNNQQLLPPPKALLSRNPIQWFRFFGPGAIIANHTRRAVETFRMFNEQGGFDLESFESALTAQLKRQGRSLIILNFPCHNPTGYSLDPGEWSGLVEVTACK